MAAVAFKLAGLDRFRAAARALPPGLATDVGPAQATIAETAADELRAAYPVLTGRLVASVDVVPLATRSPARVAAAVVVTAPYVRFVEFGTVRTPPRPTFGPTLTRARRALRDTITVAVEARGLEVR